MRVELDTSELRSLSTHLRSAGTRLEPALEGLLDIHATRAAAGGRAAAPKNRPWLSTTAGIVVETRRPLTRTIVSPLDPRGRSVGYRVEFGTSEQPPRPFLGPALDAERADFNRSALQLLVSLSL